MTADEVTPDYSPDAVERHLLSLEDARAKRDAPKPPVWLRGPQLVDEILRFANEPWVQLNLANDELARLRAGGIAVVMGGSGSGKSSLVSNLVIEHARNVGPAVVASIELPADEFGGRIVGIRCGASWEDALRGRVRHEFMADALDLPRLFVIDRDRATLKNLEVTIDAARAEYPEQSIMVAIDYAQLLDSEEREARLRVADAFKQIDRVARGKRVVAIAVSQMGRSAAKQARDGEKIGADSADGGAESAAIERFATTTLSIGLAGPENEDGSRVVELSLGKGRMSGGDRVFQMRYWGRTGAWCVIGQPKVADEVRAEREQALDAKKQATIELAIVAAADRATEPKTREELTEQITGKAQLKRSAIGCLIAKGELVEVQRRKARSKSWMVWTEAKAIAAEIPLVRDLEDLQ